MHSFLIFVGKSLSLPVEYVTKKLLPCPKILDYDVNALHLQKHKFIEDTISNVGNSNLKVQFSDFQVDWLNISWRKNNFKLFI